MTTETNAAAKAAKVATLKLNKARIEFTLKEKIVEIKEAINEDTSSLHYERRLGWACADYTALQTQMREVELSLEALSQGEKSSAEYADFDAYAAEEAEYKEQLFAEGTMSDEVPF